MIGYEFIICEKSVSLRVLTSSAGKDAEKSLLAFFTSAQTELLRRAFSQNGGICPCKEEGTCLALFTSPADPVAFAVRFQTLDGKATLGELCECEDPVVKRIYEAFLRAGGIAEAFAYFADDALIDAKMLLSEFMRTRIVYSDRIAASFGFAVVNSVPHVRRLLSFAVFLYFLLGSDAELYVELSNCGGILRLTAFFGYELLSGLMYIFPKVCDEQNAVIRSEGDCYAIEAIAAIEDDSRIGLKYGMK